MSDTPRELPRATELRRGAGTDCADHVTLDYDQRFLRRKRLRSEGGMFFLADLAQTTSLDQGDALVLEDGRLIGVRAAPELLMQVCGPDLVRIAWHVGNRHTPCQIDGDRLLIRFDLVLGTMLQGLGAQVSQVTAPFVPEGGAYGHGRTMGHEHGSAEGGAYQHHDHGHGHGHEHGHEHGHDHPHSHAHDHGAGPVVHHHHSGHVHGPGCGCGD